MKKETLAFLEKMMSSISPSGYEEEAARVWQAEAKTFTQDVRCDSHGNSDAVINPGGSPRIMFSGHYDEIGFLVSHINDDGYLWFSPIGGWDPQIPQGQRVTIRTRKGHLPGVIGKTPIHLIKAEDRAKVTPLDQLWVDIGAKNKKEAEKLVEIGDPLVLDGGLQRLQGDIVVGRAFDNRAGAFVVLEAARLLAKMNPQAEIHAVATVQEEVGLRGAKTAAFGIDPDIGIAVDVTFATDYPSMADATKRFGKIKVGGGAAITRGPNVTPKLFELLVATAKKHKIPYQVVAEGGMTGTDANVIQVNRAGVVTGLVSIPNRYMHSPVEIVSLKDMEACASLLAHTAAAISVKTSFIPV